MKPNKTLILMCGPSGAGKTTWVNEASKVIKPIHHISRDKVRFSMLSDTDSYFAKEDAVFAEWIRQIQENLDSTENCYVVADATHLNERSRNKTLDALHIPEGTKIVPVGVYPGVAKCLEQNEHREGRAKVSRSVIRRMCMSYEPPTETEKYKYDHIYAKKVER